ncbi:hypothetical protein QJS66_18735 [Kocuria rhizophila]|nr:hypothetical protein QJS66_18735 [Kocuria rhizophila]
MTGPVGAPGRGRGDDTTLTSPDLASLDEDDPDLGASTAEYAVIVRPLPRFGGSWPRRSRTPCPGRCWHDPEGPGDPQTQPADATERRALVATGGRPALQWVGATENGLPSHPPPVRRNHDDRSRARPDHTDPGPGACTVETAAIMPALVLLLAAPACGGRRGDDHRPRRGSGVGVRPVLLRGDKHGGGRAHRAEIAGESANVVVAAAGRVTAGRERSSPRDLGSAEHLAPRRERECRGWRVARSAVERRAEREAEELEAKGRHERTGGDEPPRPRRSR